MEPEKFLDLKEKLYSIINELNNTIDVHTNLNNNLIEGVLIDNKIPCEIELNKSLQDIKSVKHEIKNIIYNEINSKIWGYK